LEEHGLERKYRFNPAENMQFRLGGHTVLNIASLETVCDTVLSVEFIDQIGL